ncbi:substrate-binding domain-containing protein [Bacillus sp. Hm123]|uniref:substrate-binding domain-containing protein n=1 Tax=Bacillus sp. Hm123 TaxID=3450745 RepID=UPI003F43F9B2
MTYNQTQQLEFTGDIFMPDGMTFVKTAEEKGHIQTIEGPIAYHTPVVITPKDNPANIQSIYDLANEDVELIVPELESTALEKTAKKIFENAKLGAEIEKQILTSVETGPKVAATLQLGQGNAALAEYSAWSKQKDQFHLVEIDPAINLVDEIPCATTTYSEQPETAEQFAKFAADKGPEVFESTGINRWQINVPLSEWQETKHQVGDQIMLYIHKKDILFFHKEGELT